MGSAGSWRRHPSVFLPTTNHRELLNTMGKSQDSKKQTKKKPQKTQAEKKLAKREKKAGR
jgi:hypothetical protein